MGTMPAKANTKVQNTKTTTNTVAVLPLAESTLFSSEQAALQKSRQKSRVSKDLL